MSTKIIFGLVILCVVLFWTIQIQSSRLQKRTIELEQVQKFVRLKSDSLDYLTTKLGQVSARSTVQDLTIRNLQKLQSDRDIIWLKQINGINKRLSNVEQLSSTTIRIVANFKLPLRDTVLLVDSIKSFARAFDNRDKWYRIKGIVTDSSIIVTPKVLVPLNSVVYWQRRKLFGLVRTWPARKEYFKQTTSPNPYVEIVEDKLIRVTKQK